MPDNAREFLIGSNQGDSAHAVFEMTDSEYQWKGRFPIEGGSRDPVTFADGLNAYIGVIG